MSFKTGREWGGERFLTDVLFYVIFSPIHGWNWAAAPRTPNADAPWLSHLRADCLREPTGTNRLSPPGLSRGHLGGDEHLCGLQGPGTSTWGSSRGLSRDPCIWVGLTLPPPNPRLATRDITRSQYPPSSVVQQMVSTSKRPINGPLWLLVTPPS